MSIELEKAAQAAARRKLNTGLEPRDPVASGLHFQQREAAPQLLIVIAVLALLVLIGLALSYFSTIPPTHLVIVGLGLFWVFGWSILKRRKSS